MSVTYSFINIQICLTILLSLTCPTFTFLPSPSLCINLRRHRRTCLPGLISPFFLSTTSQQALQLGDPPPPPSPFIYIQYTIQTILFQQKLNIYRHFRSGGHFLVMPIQKKTWEIQFLLHRNKIKDLASGVFKFLHKCYFSFVKLLLRHSFTLA